MTIIVNSCERKMMFKKYMVFTMRLILLMAGFVISSIFASAQDKIVATYTPKGPVIEHTVAPKESLYALSRKYNVKVADLAAANGFEVNKSLSIGQKVFIPLTETNLNQKDKKGVAVYYAAGDGEGLLSVSKKFNKIPLKTLKDWNGLKTDAAPKDKPLVVGYLSADAKPVAKAETGKKEEKLVPKAEENITKPKKEEKPKQVAAKPEKKPELIAEEKIMEKQEKEVAAKSQEAVVDESGAFKNIFEKTTNPSLLTNRTLMSGTFKTDAGWNDKKYYMLMDGVAPGTIIKISNPQNGKVIYAKVLGSMKDVKYSEGLNIRISEAAATVLQLNSLEQFVVNVNY